MFDQDSTAAPSSPTKRARFNWISLLKANWLRFALPPLLLITLFMVTGFRGIEFGYHWDEPATMRYARAIVTEGVFLMRPYYYPGLTKTLVLVPALDDGLRVLWHGGGVRQSLAAMLLALDDAPRYLLQARFLFLAVSALAILWLYLAVWVLTRRWWQATLAAAIFGLSWELGYHARWVAPDCIVGQFAALCLLMLALHHRRGKSGWLWAAAIAAGLAAGTKYPGALLLGPVMLCAALQKTATLWQRTARVVTVGAIAFATYLVTTPGTVLDPITFTDNFAEQSGMYARGHLGYTVSVGFPHLGLLVRYLALNLFSPYMPIAVLFFGSAIAGGALCWREDWRLAAALTGFLVLFATVFCWRYPVFIVRNYLLMAPFLAFLSARGLAEPLLRLRWPTARLALAIVICGALTANAAWLISAAESIRHPNDGAAAAEAITYVRNHPHTRFRLSPRVTALAASRSLTLPANIVQANADEVVFFALSEGAPAINWLVNDPWLTRAVFGPREVNFNYYSTWSGSDRVVIMTVAKARASGASVAQ
jgi:4-amino-4-deoxy-L-arabinose transferase-like glycosyltransferase